MQQKRNKKKVGFYLIFFSFFGLLSGNGNVDLQRGETKAGRVSCWEFYNAIAHSISKACHSYFFLGRAKLYSMLDKMFFDIDKNGLTALASDEKNNTQSTVTIAMAV